MKLIVLTATVGLVLAAHQCEAGVVKRVLRTDGEGANLLKPDAWRPWKQGFKRVEDRFVCDNGADAAAHRGVSQAIALNQTKPEPIVAEAWSRAESVGGGMNNDYSLYLDLVYADGEPLWGQTAPFSVGTHDWQRRVVRVVPAKPVKHLSFHMLLRLHSGKAWFRDPVLRVIRTPHGAAQFDAVPVVLSKTMREGFQVRDVAADSDFVSFERGEALGLRLETRASRQRGAKFVEGTLSDTTGRDRAVTLVYAVPIDGTGWQWWSGPRRQTDTAPLGEYMEANRFAAGANGRLSRYPLAAITKGTEGRAIALDMGNPAFFRVGYNTGTRELFIAYDFGLTREKPTASFRFCTFDFDAAWGFRAALAGLYEIFPDHFRCRTPEQGIWMPFYKISKVKGWEDFGFKFKEGHNETAWDDAHDMITFRYTEPHTWWMRMKKEMPRTIEAAEAEVKRLAAKGHRRALILQTSGYHDEHGNFAARIRDTPWCDGAVWSVNPSPGLTAEITDFKNKWNAGIRDRLYGPKRKGDLDGEYVDSSEGYTTALLNFRRDHFADAQAPLTFSLHSRRPAQFRGLLSFEYVRALAKDVHGMGKLMMANSTPSRLCWLAPFLDVLGTETNWNRNKEWRPMSDRDLLFRRAMCGPKPYCFLMNTVFDDFPYELVEKYMKRSLAYGMFPGFFSHEASGRSHYFIRPELYNRDRPLFKKYVPLCKRVAEAGWRSVTLARSSNPKVYVERFGDEYLTVFNDGSKTQNATITLLTTPPKRSRDLVSGRDVAWAGARTEITLEGEDVAVLTIE